MQWFLFDFTFQNLLFKNASTLKKPEMVIFFHSIFYFYDSETFVVQTMLLLYNAI